MNTSRLQKVRSSTRRMSNVIIFAFVLTLGVASNVSAQPAFEEASIDAARGNLEKLAREAPEGDGSFGFGSLKNLSPI